jgi:hypothetical protein
MDGWMKEWVGEWTSEVQADRWMDSIFNTIVRWMDITEAQEGFTRISTWDC